MEVQKRASTQASTQAAASAAASKKKKTGNKESKPLPVGDTLANTIGHASNTSYTPIHTNASLFDATACKEVRNFLLAPSHSAYLTRPWNTSRTLTDEDISNPPSIVPLLYRDTTVNRRPMLAMLDDTWLTYVVYGNGYRSMDNNHVLYELCETHGNAMELGICAYFGDVEPDGLFGDIGPGGIDLQYRYMLASLLDIYGPSLQWDSTSKIYAGPTLDRKVRVLVVDGLSASVTDSLKGLNQDARGVPHYASTYISALTGMSKWAEEPRGEDGGVRARYIGGSLHRLYDYGVAEAEVAEAEGVAEEVAEAEGGAEEVAEEDHTHEKRKRKRKRHASSSSDDEKSLSDSGSDVQSNSSSSESDESSKSGSETDDEVHSSDSDDVPISKLAQSMKTPNRASNNASNRVDSDLSKTRKRPGPKPKDPSEKKKPDSAGSVRKHATDKLDRILEMNCLFEGSLSTDVRRDVTSAIDKVKYTSSEYLQEGKVENSRAFIDAQTDLTKVLMKTLASVCRENDSGGGSSHRRLAVIMATLYESESSQFESIAQAMVSMGSKMKEMVKKRTAAGEEAEAEAGVVVGAS